MALIYQDRLFPCRLVGYVTHSIDEEQANEE